MFLFVFAVWAVLGFSTALASIRASRAVYEAVRIGRYARRYRAVLAAHTDPQAAYEIDSQVRSQLDERDRATWVHLISDPLWFAIWRVIAAVYLAAVYLWLFGWLGIITLVGCLVLGLLPPSTSATALHYLHTYLDEHAPEPVDEPMSWQKAKALVVAAAPLYAYLVYYPLASLYQLMSYGGMISGWYTLALVPVVIVVSIVHSKLMYGVLRNPAYPLRYLPVPKPPAAPNRRAIDPQPGRASDS